MTSLPTPLRSAVATALALLCTGCGGPGSPGPQLAGIPAGVPLSLVVVVARTARHIAQVVRVVQDYVTPEETLVVTLLATTPAAATYVVRAGDSLSSIASDHGIALAAL